MFSTNQIVRGHKAGVFVIMSFRIGADGERWANLKELNEATGKLMLLVACHFQRLASSLTNQPRGFGPIFRVPMKETILDITLAIVLGLTFAAFALHYFDVLVY